jgi:hypothetical protein
MGAGNMPDPDGANHGPCTALAVLQSQYLESHSTTTARFSALQESMLAMATRMNEVETNQKLARVSLDPLSKILIALCPLAVVVVTWLLNHAK